MSLFLLQAEKSPNALPNKALFSEDTATVFSLINEYNWLHPNEKHRCMTASLSKLPSMSLRTLKCCIPIGSIEFVEEVLRLAHGVPQLTPIVIPNEILRHPEWLGRRVAFEKSIEQAPEVFERFGVDQLFIKSASHLKTDFTDIYRRSNPLPKTDDAIFFSECIDLVSEWRAFVFRSRLVDVRCYAGNPWLLPDKKTVLDMVSVVSNTLPACTVDVGVTAEGKTVVIEIHNFISCGLYGARPPLNMYVTAYRHELRIHT